MKSPIINTTLTRKSASLKEHRQTPPLPHDSGKLSTQIMLLLGNFGVLLMSIVLLVIKLIGRYESMTSFVYLMPSPKIVFQQSIVGIRKLGKNFLKNLALTVRGFFFSKPI